MFVGIACALLFSMGIKMSFPVKAASATLTFSAEKRTVTVGDVFYVVLVLDSGENIGGFEGYISYDSEIAEFDTGGKFVNGGEGLLRINDVDSTEASTTKKYSLKFKAKKTGECVFDTSEAPAVYNEAGEDLSVSSNKLSISVHKSKSLSSNNRLAKLMISPGELNQEYSNDITAYKTEVPYENDMLFISAVPEREDAAVTVEGNEDLKPGKNFVHVVVTAPSGDKRDVQIEVTRLEEGASQAADIEKAETGLVLSKDKENNLVLSDKHIYTAAKLEDDSAIPAFYEKSELTLEGEKLEAYVLSRDQGNEFVLLYLTNEKGNTGFYKYDRVEKTIQRYEQENSIKDKEKPLGPEKEKTGKAPVSISLVAVLGIIILVLVIYSVIITMKNKNRREK